MNYQRSTSLDARSARIEAMWSGSALVRCPRIQGRQGHAAPACGACLPGPGNIPSSLGRVSPPARCPTEAFPRYGRQIHWLKSRIRQCTQPGMIATKRCAVGKVSQCKSKRAPARPRESSLRSSWLQVHAIFHGMNDTGAPLLEEHGVPSFEFRRHFDRIDRFAQVVVHAGG
jgi:hypothetical protein